MRSNNKALSLVLIASITCLLLANCQQVFSQKPKEHRFTRKLEWKAEDYFDDLQIFDLCQAIEENDISEIKAMIAEGVDVNAKGKGNMTPLLWALSGNRPEVFDLLLQAGADPNVLFTDNFGSKSINFKGMSVTHISCLIGFSYFDSVFKNGGDFNLRNRSKRAYVSGRTPMFLVIRNGADKKRIARLLELGVDVNQREPDSSGAATPLMVAAGRGKFDLCLLLLEHGADPSLYDVDFSGKLIHTLAFKKPIGPEHKASYKKLVDELRERGESVELAREDLERRYSYIKYNDFYRQKMYAAERAKNKKNWLDQQKQKQKAGDPKLKKPSTITKPIDYQQRVAKWSWQWSDLKVGPLSGLPINPYSLKINTDERNETFNISIIEKDEVRYSWRGHRFSVFKIVGTHLYFVDWNPILTGGQVVAVDLVSGKELWREKLLPLGFTLRPPYSSMFNIDADDEVVTVWGKESAGKYVEVKSAGSGASIGHKPFEK